MNIIETIVLNEKPEEVILFLTKNVSGISFPRLDGIYNRANWAHVSDNWQLLCLVRKMSEAGLVSYSGSGIVRGPNWREPTFMVEKKYIIE